MQSIGRLFWYSELNSGKSANGWSSKNLYPGGALQQEKNYIHGKPIEKIMYDESGQINAQNPEQPA